jgi:hypothetical protein
MKIAEEENKRIDTSSLYISYLWTYDLYGPVHNTLMRATSITRASGRGFGPVNQDIFRPYEIASSRNGECHLGPKKVEISRALPLATCPSNESARIKSITDMTVSIRGPYAVICT